MKWQLWMMGALMLGLAGASVSKAADAVETKTAGKTGTRAEAKAEKKVTPQTHDFEAEIIEGQQKAPDLFRQTNTDKLGIDAVIYLRKDFNDFHYRDSRRRPILADPPSQVRQSGQTNRGDQRK